MNPYDPGPQKESGESAPEKTPKYEIEAQDWAPVQESQAGNSSPAKSPGGSDAKHEKPRVRFNSSAAERPPGASVKPSASKLGERKEPPHSSPGLNKPRPVLLRNPSSYNSVKDPEEEDVVAEAMSPEKAKAAAAAAKRAQAVALDAHRTEPNAEDREYEKSSRRSSLDSAAATDTSFPDTPSEHDVHFPRSPESQGNGDQTTEVEELFQAHTKHLGSDIKDKNTTAAHDAQDHLENDYEDPDNNDYTVSGNAKGGVFYQILQTYRQPPAYGSQERIKKPESRGSSGTATPTRKKWYNQHETRSQETLARLVAASAQLANPSEKEKQTGSSERRRRPGHKRSTSNRIMSFVGLAPEQEARIKIHVADILQRQKYIIKLCRALMLFGAPTHRLEEYLAMTAKVLEVDSQFLYIPGCMVISFDDALTHTAEVKIVRTAQGVNLAKLKDTHDIYKEVLHDVINLEEALTRLEELFTSKDRYPVWVLVLMYGLASLTVSVFFSARFIDMPVIFVLGTLLGVLQLVIAPMSKTYSTVFEISSAILMSFLSRAIASAGGGGIFCFSALTQSSIAMILPGWLVLSSSLELQSKAVVPGSIRMVYAIIYSLFLGYGITVGTALYGAMDPHATTETTCQDTLNPYWNFLFVPLYIFFTTFTVQAKWRQMPAMIIIAFAGYVVNFYSSKKFSASAPIAYTFGAFAVGVLANLYSRLRHGVAAAVLLPAVYVQVPGSLASSGALVSGLQTAAALTNPALASSTDSNSLNAIVFNVAASMIQIAIGITVGLFMSALVVYPLGKRRSGLWTL